ncbi:hypothetical protein NG895_12525 [Aeoliella sp. ICT_H6.2]|uniref:Sulfotransferase family protein n=1 Tax=Aeoliella straminimaris TaxID=2954799 RepID=A0A9X2FE97_9BACT|nr:sulfotransferase family protein [Aeoliella straminimaris]MCO6044734.1 hypothetical protein [Aeoliella straminimaris]
MTKTWNKVFGIGLSKTGTTSLAAALRKLSIRIVDYPNDARTQEQLETGDYELDVLRDSDGMTDTPAAYCFAQLDKTYPDSLFILTERENRDRWLESLRSQWETTDRWGKHHRQSAKFAYFIRCANYGVRCYVPERLKYAYERHSEEVRQYFSDKPGRLLTLDITKGDGWKQLCEFLDMPIPDEPFPHANSRSEKAKQVAYRGRLEACYDAVEQHVPRGELLVVLDDEVLHGTALHELRRCMPLVNRAGVYDGFPVDQAQCLQHTEELKRNGGQFLFVFYTNFWWYEHYPAWSEYMATDFQLLHADDGCHIYRAK